MLNRSGGNGCVSLLATIGLILLILLVLGAFTNVGLSLGLAEKTSVQQSGPEVAAASSIEVQNQIGRVTVRGGDSLSYRITRHAWGATDGTASAELERMKVTVAQNGGNLLIIAEAKSDLGKLRFNLIHDSSIDVEVVAPASVAVKVRADVSDVEVSSYGGSLDLLANVGSLKVATAALSGPLKLETKTGGINFSGQLAPGENSIKTAVGSIDLILPTNPPISFSGKCDVGNISLDPAFNLPNAVQRAGTGETIQTTGNVAERKLNVQAATGSINIKASK